MDKFEKHWSDYLEGDDRALGELYSTIFEPLVFRAIYYLREPENARDIVSQVFEELLSAPVEIRKHRWRDIRDTNAFLLVIVRNKCLDYLKVNANRQRILKGLPQEQALHPEENMEKELFAKLNECISQLSDEERQLLEMHLNGYRNAAIATELNLSEKTVRNKLSITRKLLTVRWQQLFIFIGFLWK